VVIQAASEPDWRGIPAHDSVTAQVEFNGRGGIDRQKGSNVHTFTLDSAAGPSSLGLSVVEELGIRATDAIRIEEDTVAGGGSTRMAIVPALLYLKHNRPWYHWLLAIENYCAFLVEFHIPVDVFLSPRSVGLDEQKCWLGQDVIQVLRHKGNEKMKTAKSKLGDFKWILWDLEPNLQVRFGRRVEFRKFPYDVRPWESQMDSIEMYLHQRRRDMGLE
jgi:hypothetical protein